MHKRLDLGKLEILLKLILLKIKNYYFTDYLLLLFY